MFLSGNDTFDLHLPCFRQGDDLGHHLRIEGSTAEAFLALAERHEASARLCRRMAGISIEVPDLRVTADRYSITVEGPRHQLQGLVDDNVLSEMDDEDREDAAHRLWCCVLGILDDGEDQTLEGIVRGPGTCESIVARLEKLPEWTGINPVWVQEILTNMVNDEEVLLDGEVYSMWWGQESEDDDLRDAISVLLDSESQRFLPGVSHGPTTLQMLRVRLCVTNLERWGTLEDEALASVLDDMLEEGLLECEGGTYKIANKVN
jgi:hypothetical protein